MSRDLHYWDGEFRTDEAREAYYAAIRQWGEDDQLQKLAEECSELAAITNKILLGQADLLDIREELIDARQTMEIVSTFFMTNDLSDQAEAQLDDFLDRVEADEPGGVPTPNGETGERHE